jgi:hypothetical protein
MAFSQNISTTRFEYDPWNRVTRHTLPDPDGRGLVYKTASTTITYGDFGNTVGFD